MTTTTTTMQLMVMLAKVLMAIPMFEYCWLPFWCDRCWCRCNVIPTAFATHWDAVPIPDSATATAYFRMSNKWIGISAPNSLRSILLLWCPFHPFWLSCGHVMFVQRHDSSIFWGRESGRKRIQNRILLLSIHSRFRLKSWETKHMRVPFTAQPFHRDFLLDFSVFICNTHTDGRTMKGKTMKLMGCFVFTCRTTCRLSHDE